MESSGFYSPVDEEAKCITQGPRNRWPFKEGDEGEFTEGAVNKVAG